MAATQDAPEPSQAARQLHEYLRGERTRFDLALVERGTPFDRAVWHQLQQIPFGETLSYGEIAAKLGRPGIARAVGLANGRNPFAIVVPCHRVIGKHGSLVGYAGGLEVKRLLLELESRQTTLPTLGVSPRVDRGDADATASHAASSRGRGSTLLSRDPAFESAFQDADHGELRS